MITVRFPNGFSVQYNDACAFKIEGDIIKIYRAHGRESEWFAWVPVSSGALVEGRSPCRTYDAATSDTNAMVDTIMDRLKQVSYGRLADLKRRLATYNVTRREWSE